MEDFKDPLDKWRLGNRITGKINGYTSSRIGSHGLNWFQYSLPKVKPTRESVFDKEAVEALIIAHEIGVN